MATPLRHLPAEPPTQARVAHAEPDRAWLRALLRIFADLACRLR